MSYWTLFDSFEYGTYVMNVRSLEIFNHYSAGIDLRRRNLTPKVDPRTERVNPVLL